MLTIKKYRPKKGDGWHGLDLDKWLYAVYNENNERQFIGLKDQCRQYILNVTLAFC